MMYDDIKQDIYLHFVKYDNLKRYNHSIKVMEKALEIVEQNNFYVDLEQIKLSAMLHDVGKVIPECEQLKIIKERKNEFGLSDSEYEELLKCPNVWHSFVGGILAKDKFGINDKAVIDAINYHTSGKPNMSLLCKIIYVSDVIEDSRTYKTADIYREYVRCDFDNGLYEILKEINRMLEEKDEMVFSLTKNACLYYKEKKWKEN